MCNQRRSMDTNARTHLLVKVAKLYFEDGLTQQQIASSLRISRSTVSRLLTKARIEGIVHIEIKVPRGMYPELEKAIEEAYHLVEVIIHETSETDSPDTIALELGQAAARYLERTIQPDDTIGFAWGMTMKAMVDSVRAKKLSGIKVCQMNGGLTSQMTDIHGTSLTSHLATKLEGDAYILQAPGVVDSPQTQKIFMADAQVQGVFDLAEQADMAFFGIGTLTGDTLWGRAGLLPEETIEELKNLGAVGDIMSRYFDSQGRLVNSSLCQRVVGFPIQQLRRIHRRVGVAGGKAKFKAIQGALRGGYLNVLITDQETAKNLIKSHQSH